MQANFLTAVKVLWFHTMKYKVCFMKFHEDGSITKGDSYSGDIYEITKLAMRFREQIPHKIVWIEAN